jgi:hypothetical protein
MVLPSAPHDFNPLLGARHVTGSAARLDQPDECADHAVKECPELWLEGLEPSESLGCLEASQGFASGSCSY